MITLVGVGHVFDISRQVAGIIAEKAPVAVALELDRGRLSVLLARERGEELPRQRGVLAKFQERIAKDFGVEAGDEMLAGYKAAEDINARLYLIDMDINNVLARINSQLTAGERLRMLGALFATPFIRKKTVEREMERYSEDGEAYLEGVGRSFPTVKKVLLDQRNEHMASQLMRIEDDFGPVLALIGDGHVPGISILLGQRVHECIRLKDLRRWEPRQSDGTVISFTFNA